MIASLRYSRQSYSATARRVVCLGRAASFANLNDWYIHSAQNTGNQRCMRPLSVHSSLYSVLSLRDPFGVLQVVHALQAGSRSTVSVSRPLLLFSIQRHLLPAAAALPQQQQLAALEAFDAVAVVEPAHLPASLWCAAHLSYAFKANTLPTECATQSVTYNKYAVIWFLVASSTQCRCTVTVTGRAIHCMPCDARVVFLLHSNIVCFCLDASGPQYSRNVTTLQGRRPSGAGSCDIPTIALHVSSVSIREGTRT